MDTTIYAHRSDGSYASYNGMTHNAVVAMLAGQGLSCTFIDEETYQVAIEAQQGK